MTGYAAMQCRKLRWWFLGLFGVEPGEPVPTGKLGELYIPELGRVVRLTVTSTRVFALASAGRDFGKRPDGADHRLMRADAAAEIRARVPAAYPDGFVLPWLTDSETGEIVAIGLVAPPERVALPGEKFEVRFNYRTVIRGDVAAALNSAVPLSSPIVLHPGAEGSEYLWDIEIIAPAEISVKFILHVVTPVGV